MYHSFRSEVAEKYGVEKAILLENFYFWIKKNEANKTNIHEGRAYTYNTTEAYEKLFPYMKARRIAQLLREMETEDDLLISGQFGKYDRTKSYTLADNALSILGDSNIQNLDNETYRNLTIKHQESVCCLNTDINHISTTNLNTDINQSVQINEKEKGNNITQMLPDCYQNVTQSIEYREQNLEKEKEFREKSEKENFSVLMETVFNMISEHNGKQTEAKRKIAISKDLFTFESKEGRMLVDMIKSRTPKEIVSALKNYLFVANMKNTWVNMFTFNAFCKGLDKYLPEYFDYESFADYNIDYDHSNDVDLLFVNKMENEPRFDNYLFDKHVKEWIANGCPENEEYYKLQETWR